MTVGLLGLPSLPTPRTSMQKAPDREAGRLKDLFCNSKVVHFSPGKAFTFDAHTCTQTREMHSSGVTGWMQIGYDSPEAMMYWVIGATHEWRCSTTHSKSPFLLSVPTDNLSPTPTDHSFHSISKQSSRSGHIYLYSSSFLSDHF